MILEHWRRIGFARRPDIAALALSAGRSIFYIR